MTIKGKATTSIIIEWDGSAETLIAFTDEFSQDSIYEQIDSLDLGDSLGFWETYFRGECESLFDEMEFSDGEFTLKITAEIDLFQWEGIE
jgi:hypothetical protein